MSNTMHTTFQISNALPLRGLFLTAATVLAISVAAPGGAAAAGYDVEFDGFSFNDDEDLLEQLIALDAGDIAELRSEMAEARADIREAVSEIEEARAEVREAPGGAIILEAALTTARVVVSTTVKRALKKVDRALTRAESDLAAVKDTISADEFIETQLAISVIREEIDGLEDALGELMDAMKA